MRFDVFCSLAQTPRPDGLPGHTQVLAEFLDQAVAADELGYGCLWVAESHYSSETQKLHKNPVIPHWTGEVGLNTDLCQLAAQVFRRTRRIEVGSAILNLLANGGPVAAAERVAAALAWHGLDPAERRRLRVGFAGGRFDFIARTAGIGPRNRWEQDAWPQVRNAIVWEAAEIFVRLLRGDELAATDVPERALLPRDFPDRAHFDAVAARAAAGGERIELPRRWDFEVTRIVPDFRRELLELYAGTHDPGLQSHLNTLYPVRVFNLSITKPAVIEATHGRMAAAYHPDGGRWQRSYMPRTVFVFVDDGPGGRERRQARAAERAERTLAAYWRALDGTIDPAKVAEAVNNALVGDPEGIAEQIIERFDPRERLMLWFDFFTQRSGDALDGMSDFRHRVVPLLAERGIPIDQG